MHKHHRTLVTIGVLSLSIIVLALYAFNLVYFDTVIHSVIAQTPLQVGIEAEHLAYAVSNGFRLVSAQENDSYTVPSKILNSWFEEYMRWYTGKNSIRIKQPSVAEFLTPIAAKIKQAPENARFDFVDGRLTTSIPAQSGRDLNVDRTIRNILLAIKEDRSSAEIAFDLIAPTITAEYIDNLQITELLGHGESNFSGSPNARVHNIKIGANVFNSRVILPDEEFSFNTTLGVVDETTGYLPELVIRGQKLIPEYGGGLCQVSTTLYRAALASGLQIVERHPHSFPVKYYNPQGFDAAIYPGVIDLRFKNDTGKPILIQSKVKGNEISFDLFGTSDGRVITLNEPRIYESNEDGSLKTVMSRFITPKGGVQKQENFYSNYRSPGLFEKITTNPLE